MKKSIELIQKNHLPQMSYVVFYKEMFAWLIIELKFEKQPICSGK